MATASGSRAADAAPFAGLKPDLILDAVERWGLRPDGRLLALNSYENRVYRVGIEDAPAVVAKFYRPGRWSDAAIVEEHAFAAELAAHEIPVAAPLASESGDTLLRHADFRVALFPMLAGEWPELDRPGRLAWVGRFLGRIHAIGRTRPFVARPAVDVQSLGRDALDFLRDSRFLPQELETEYVAVAGDLLDAVAAALESVACFTIRLHGDCHPGNVLWSDAGPAFVDLDDCRNGPAVQDLWMLVAGDAHEQRAQLASLLEGYRVFCEFDERELALVEALRGLRMVYYSGWLARRWGDPAFPRSFPWFGSHGYWRGQVEDLRVQSALLAR